MSERFLCVVAATVVACGDNTPQPRTLSLNEVSVLLPLPHAAAEAEHLLRPTDEGRKGALLPTWAYPTPALIQSEDRLVTLGALRLVAIRIDPCWPNIGVADRSKCERVLHLVWQPIVTAWEADASSLAAADAAVHAFHRVTDAELDTIVDQLDGLAAGTAIDSTLPLQPNPAIVAQGLGGSYYAGIRQLVLDHAGADNLFEMTFLSLRATQQNPYIGQGWLLSGAAFSDGKAYRVPVATTGDDEEHFGNNVAGTTPIEDQTEFLGDFTPASANTDTLLAIVGDSHTAQTAALSEIQAAVDLTLIAENPLETTLESADCMSCHVSTSARRWAVDHRGIDISANPHRYTNADYDLRLLSDSETRTNAVHGLGWYGIHSAFSQRTVNDTAAAASFISAHLRGHNP